MQALPPVPILPEIYLAPKYINLDMIRNIIGKSGITLTINDDPYSPGLYELQATDLVAKGESYVIKTILSDFVNIPLQSVYYTGDPYGTDFNILQSDNKYVDTYVQIRGLFIASALWQIYKFYYSTSGTGNGANLIRNQANVITAYTNSLQRINQAGSLSVKNAFAGLKPALNASKRIPNGVVLPNDIPNGDDAEWDAFNAHQNYRRSGFPIF